jgi:hypothetical protein
MSERDDGGSNPLEGDYYDEVVSDPGDRGVGDDAARGVGTLRPGTSSSSSVRAKPALPAPPGRDVAVFWKSAERSQDTMVAYG